MKHRPLVSLMILFLSLMLITVGLLLPQRVNAALRFVMSGPASLGGTAKDTIQMKVFEEQKNQVAPIQAFITWKH